MFLLSIPSTNVFRCPRPARLLTPKAPYQISSCSRPSPLFTRVDTRSMVEPATVQDTIIDTGDVGVRRDRDVVVAVTGAVVVAHPKPEVADPVCVVEAEGVRGELPATLRRHGTAADLGGT